MVTARALVQSLDLAVAAEELGLADAYVRVHHVTRQLASLSPLLAAIREIAPAIGWRPPTSR